MAIMTSKTTWLCL